MMESEGMNGQIGWQAQQTLHLACSFAGQESSEARGICKNMDRPKHHSIHCLNEKGVEKGSGRPSTLPDRERSVFNDTNIRGQPWGNCLATGRSAYGPFRALRCHLGEKLEPKPRT